MDFSGPIPKMGAMAELTTPAKVKTRVREAVAAAPQGLDAAIAAIAEALADGWRLERCGHIGARDLPDFVESIVQALRKIAHPPPKKVKFSDPLRKILPCSEASMKPGLDVALFLLALGQVGDYTETTDKRKANQELFLDDWRRLLWEGARITDWGKFRTLAGGEERVIEGRLSRDVALATLEAIHKRRVDNLTRIPELSVVACARCGKFQGLDRSRCALCKGTYCSKCLSPTADLCLVDYSTRYAPIDPERRAKLAGDARALLKEFRLDPYARNEAFVRALRDKGVDVAFVDNAPLEGVETNASQGRHRLEVLGRESLTIHRVMFGSLGRALMRSADDPADPLQVEFFVDICMGLPIEEAMRATAPQPTT
jgi:hypothetical protein